MSAFRKRRFPRTPITRLHTPAGIIDPCVFMADAFRRHGKKVALMTFDEIVALG